MFSTRRNFFMLPVLFSFKKVQIAIILFLVFITLKVVIDLKYLSKVDNKHPKRSKNLIGKFSPFEILKADYVSFNEIVLESENVGQETELVSDKKSYLLEKGDKDLNAAFEILSPQEDGKEEILSFNKINQALTNSNKSFNQSVNYFKSKKNIQIPKSVNFVWSKSELEKSHYWNFRNFSSSEIAALSVLGRRLFLHENIGEPANQKFLIHIYKFGKRLERRFIYQYGKTRKDPLENCSVKNCIFSYEESDLPKADCVFFHLHLMEGPPTHLERKNLGQRWVWLSDESIFHTFLVAKEKNLDKYNMFNWSMSYRSDSDVPVPYGRTIPLLRTPSPSSIDEEIFDKKSKTAAFMSSNCQTINKRLKYVKNLEKYIEIDTYGRCGKKQCSQHFNTDCALLDQYKFYLAFENANCKEYITEKAWWNAFAKKSVPVVMGCPKVYYARHFPPNSFIHVDDFSSSEELAHYLRFLSQDKEAYNKYHEWRKKYEVVNEHGYFHTNVFHYCRLCEALNYNDPSPKVSNMKQFWNISRDCNTVSYTN